jgi:hypothetical protein
MKCTKNIGHNSRCSGRDSNSEPTEYESKEIPLWHPVRQRWTWNCCHCKAISCIECPRKSPGVWRRTPGTILSRVWRLYKTGFGLLTGFIGSQYTQLQRIHFVTHTAESLTESLLWTFSLIQLRAQFCSHCNHSHGIPCHHSSSAKSKSLYDRRSVGQCVLISSPIWGSWPDITSNFCLTVTVLSMSGPPLWREVGSVVCISHLSIQIRE